MKTLYTTVLLLFLTGAAFGQEAASDKLVELGKAYKNYMFQGEPPKGFVQKLTAAPAGPLQATSNFIGQTISKDNELLEKEYLTIPDEQTLKNIYAVCQINYNLRKENAPEHRKLLDSLRTAPTSRYELIDNYYNMLFNAVGNKNRPFNLSKIDIQLNEYGLKDDTEKGILFLKCMDQCGTHIWGYMNIVKPANTREAYSYIKRFPKINGSRYFQYTDLYFPDFQMVIVKDKGLQSYKSYYLNKYYDLLLSHLVCLYEEGAKESDRNDLLLSSALKERALYKYSKNQAALEKLFQEKKQ
ncbi:hypothetical protein [Hymenobacter cellulosilyticus]|uniref:DUF4919 domain-containing protein n=1 Tax=Hymenobacter cellulosilyticus TaxID=2932248 RepID=A0A8T9Q1Y6_9BACT|nr:hypothetical protein [Hymenobacter cellulosilyticus]UOQ70922.1 hypothetical protein MUN79_19905 [Hymenobacter cellulosilyticus]